MQTALQLRLNLPQSVLVLVLCVWIAARGRPQWALGIYLALMTWTRTLMVLGIAHTWVLLATLVLASALALVGRSDKPALPAHDRWIILWMGVWAFWMVLLILLFQPAVTMNILRSWWLICLMPLPFLSLFVRNDRDNKGLAVAFVVTKLASEAIYFSRAGFTVSSLMQNPTLGGWGAARLGIVNYHWWGIGYAISTILSVALVATEKKPLPRLLYTCGGLISAWLLMLSRSRQSILGTGMVLALFFLWLISKKVASARRYLLVLAGALAIGVSWLYRTSPDLLLRAYDATHVVSLTANLEASAGVRTGLWAFGWRVFLESPVWGAGFVHTVMPHNFLVGTLSDQGLMGFAFLVGFLLFLLRQAHSTIATNERSELSIWRMAWLCIASFAVIRGQASGAVYSLWDLYWAAAILWASHSAASATSDTEHASLAPNDPPRSSLRVQPTRLHMPLGRPRI